MDPRTPTVKFVHRVITLGTLRNGSRAAAAGQPFEILRLMLRARRVGRASIPSRLWRRVPRRFRAQPQRRVKALLGGATMRKIQVCGNLQRRRYGHCADRHRGHHWHPGKPGAQGAPKCDSPCCRSQPTRKGAGYFSDGLTEEMTRDRSRAVAYRGHCALSSMAFKPHTARPRDRRDLRWTSR